ncbi:hypothetical protein [Streptomyces bikiniensis]|uniref:hypothetical protein n=1 Tax=Streptomyces bikiniensis TaxID=1896 RepID=UPI0004C077CD|nr:hypothetical protein [Streptomyces bikiniensis]
MPLPADRTALDLTDALLEALWDGRDLPQGPDVPVVEEGGEPVRRVLDRLRRIPREPADDFVRHVGTPLMEFRGRRCPWNAAALRLFEDPYAFAATGPRRHEDRAYDVHAVMCRSVPDPRGWTHVDGDRFNGVRRALPSYPFDPPAPSETPGRLHPLETEEAVAALAVMAEEWQGETAPVRSRPNRDALPADARTLLERYGPAARYRTDATAAATDPAPDFLAAGLQGTRTHGFLTSEGLDGLYFFEDLGVIAVSDDEVGVFWSFGAC